MKEVGEIKIAEFICVQCKEPLSAIPQLFPKAHIDQSEPQKSAKCGICGWNGQFGESVKAV